VTLRADTSALHVLATEFAFDAHFNEFGCGAPN
jgi:hypothetical protein